MFITVNMDTRVQNEIATELVKLKNLYSGGRWVTKDNLHLTMLFLGEVQHEKLTIVKQHLKESVRGISPFALRIEGIGNFPSIDKSNILWAGVKGDLEKLNILFNQLLNEIRKMDLPIDGHSRFHPHVTLARKIGQIAPDKNTTFITSTWEIDSLELYQSIFTANGMKYQRILSEKFTKSV